jgi:hypothetical protein
LSRIGLGVLLGAATACVPGGEQGGEARQDSTVHVAAPKDSLVATNRSGIEIWFTLAREATGSDGTRCIERGIEIRRGSARLKVPLLYTGSAPVLLNDSTMRALLWNHCVPGDAYLVNLRSGQPVRER